MVQWGLIVIGPHLFHQSIMTHRLAQIVLLLCIIVVTQASKFSIALISDTHIGNGNGEQTVQRIKHVVKLVNENIEKYNIKWVFHTGDVTDMAYPKTFEEINEILKTLRVHWFPLVGKSFFNDEFIG